jgi:release factor glutamine methyltransferase
LNIAQAVQAAKAQGLDHLEAQTLLLHALAQDPHDRAWLLLHDTDELHAQQLRHFMQLVEQRLQHVPLGYLTGWQDFHGLALQVDARVLVPRPDTETLVDWALELLAERRDSRPGPRVLYLGTGSGAIALALAHARPALRVAAVDRSADALAVARGNASRVGLAVDFRLAHWLDGAPTGLHLIVSNPPYLTEAEVAADPAHGANAKDAPF